MNVVITVNSDVDTLTIAHDDERKTLTMKLRHPSEVLAVLKEVLNALDRPDTVLCEIDEGQVRYRDEW